ncbi:putative cellulose synthase (UDP-forming) [Helianthus annuus]|nr:putative cellulose synthase (UDP-forming) [Helianthus annuus]KAJ0510435.1 putative cellulose synthase (UDP-forming) [Helianthus annuus]KAJ0518320.1 putative cellulose synthase (UDP-forming) [Helianthus annuus]KAJ0686353.1 putative cellulose synthase (UDP-forming) [Helianthus annuus]
MEEWWKRHNNKLQMVKHQDDGGGHGADDPDLPMMDKGESSIWSVMQMLCSMGYGLRCHGSLINFLNGSQSNMKHTFTICL